MRITLRSVGGFTGAAGAETRTVEVDSLAPAEAKRMRKLVDACGFFSLPPKLAKASPKPWDFVHHLEIEDGGRTHAVQFHEDEAPPALRELLTALRACP
jgi:hypothetical protein